ncbi:conserved Plasmodium protein, unknown function [Plasmodium ovale curtisi]|uniref:Uncharacterized protein n=1 Tax=Plasmodium ovale curtisi TaxID=864141 RepID=A0A1A8X9R8_PLAOA|nr:conserved Plasmodium protein, unknown function [Plasmodium ovale curtisi]
MANTQDTSPFMFDLGTYEKESQADINMGRKLQKGATRVGSVRSGRSGRSARSEQSGQSGRNGQSGPSEKSDRNGQSDPSEKSERRKGKYNKVDGSMKAAAEKVIPSFASLYSRQSTHASSTSPPSSLSSLSRSSRSNNQLTMRFSLETSSTMSSSQPYVDNPHLNRSSFDFSDTSASSSAFSSGSSSSCETSLLSFPSKSHVHKGGKSYHKNYRDVSEQMCMHVEKEYISVADTVAVVSAYSATVATGIPICLTILYRLLFCVKYKVILTLIVKNILFLLFRSYKLNEYRLIEKEKHKKNKSNLDFHFYNIFNFDSESNSYFRKENGKNKKKKSPFIEKNMNSRINEESNSTRQKRKFPKSIHPMKSIDTSEIGKDKKEHEEQDRKQDREQDREQNKEQDREQNKEQDREQNREQKRAQKRVRKKKKKKVGVLQIFKDEFKENKKKIILKKGTLMGITPSEQLSPLKGEDNGRIIIDDNKVDGVIPVGGGKSKRKVRLSWREKRQLRKKYRKFVNFIHKLKYKREIPIYRFTIRDHFIAMYNFLCKRFNTSNFVYFDDKVIFSYFTNIRLILVMILDYLLKIGITIFFILILMNNHIFINNQKVVYIHDFPIKYNSEKEIYFPDNFDLSNYQGLKLPEQFININYINTDIENVNKRIYKRYKPNGFVNLDIPDNIFKLRWDEIFIHFTIFIRALFNCKYVHYRREIGGKKASICREGKKDELRYSVSISILFLLCKYGYAPINLNSLLFGKNILNNILLIDNINSFTWVNILYEEIPLVPDKNSPYITCRDILKYYSEEGFFSSESTKKRLYL